MKKVMSLLLACLILLPFAACVNDPAESSDAYSQSESETSAEESKAVVVNELVNAIDATLGEAPDRTINKRNVLSGLRYTASRAENDTYTDTEHTKLTDGVIVNDFNKYSWVGYDGGKAVTLDFDLGQITEGIADIVIGTFRQTEYGIGTPIYIEISVSEDGESYTKLARVYAPAEMLISQKYTFDFALQGVVRAQYLRIFFAPQDKGFLFLDEISAYVYDGSDEKEPDNADYYVCGLPEKAAEKYWPSTEDDYDKTINLAYGAKMYFVQYAPIPQKNCAPGDNTPVSSSKLNDGSYGSAISWDNVAFTRFTRGEGRDVIYDLGALSSVSSVKGAALSQQEWGVFVPVGILVSVSADGENWQSMDLLFLEGGATSAHLEYFESKFDAPRTARFVKFSFALVTHASLVELEVIGTKKIADNSLPVTPDTKSESFAGTFLNPADADGMHNIACTPIGSGRDDTFDFGYGMNTVEDYIPCVGYVEDGVIKDTFFDNFLFSPTSQFVNVEERRTLKGWKHYIDAEFLEDYNIPALDEATAQVKDSLGLEDYKSGILLSVMRTFKYLDENGTVINGFGDIDGDGENDSFTSLDNRKKAIKWLIDTQLEKFTSSNFENLKLMGFYWQEESIIDSDSDELVLLAYASEYIHSLGYKLLWIPYYKATGFDQWAKYGIDYACLQPNYSFMATPDDYRLDTAAKLAKLYGMCVEIECGDHKNPDSVVKYKEYLQKGVEYGYMYALKVYYLDVLPGEIYSALSNENEYTREIYRDTYLFAKEKLDSSYRAIKESDAAAPADIEITVKSGKHISGTLTADTDYAFTPELSLLPKYGYIRLNRDGSFVYYAPKNFTGTEIFCVRFAYAGNVSEEATVTVTVN